MKKILIIISAACALGFVSCGQGGANRQGKTTTTTHNARNSLDYQGTYEGVVLIGKDEVRVEVVLEKDKYIRTMSEAAGGKVLKIQKGAYTWNDEGNTVMLQRADQPNLYFVTENRIVQLDKSGDNAINSKYAEKRTLSKIR